MASSSGNGRSGYPRSTSFYNWQNCDQSLVPYQVIIFISLLTLFSQWLQKVLSGRVLAHTALDPQHRYTVARFLSLGVFVLGLMVGIDTAGVDLRSVALLGSALGLGVGLGLQPIVSNFVAGLVLLMERPIKLGDRIDAGGTNGEVVRIGSRSTWVCTNDNEIIIVPNSDFITNRLTNWTANDPKIRFSLKVGVSYASDPEIVKQILLEMAAGQPDVLHDPPPEVILSDFGDNALIFVLRIWSAKELGNPQRLKSDLYFSILKSFRHHGIELPFPQRDLHLRSVDPSIGNALHVAQVASKNSVSSLSQSKD